MKVWKSFSRKAELENANFAESVANQFSGLKVNDEQVKTVLRNDFFSKRPSEWSKEILMKFAGELREQSKPMIIAANKVDCDKGKENYEKLKAEFPNLVIIPCSADSELALREATKANLINIFLEKKILKLRVNLMKNKKKVLKLLEQMYLQNLVVQEFKKVLMTQF